MKNLATTLFIYLYSAVLLLLLKGCANIVPPTGGPKDNKAAKLLRSTPMHEAINFRGKFIILEFDELIRIDNIAQKTIITPYIDPANIEFKSDKTKVIIKLDSLQNNTTYNFSFPDCIMDVNEGNTTVYQLAFSTGPFLDSIKVHGKVTFPGGTKVREALIALYEGKFDTTSLSKRPVYLSKVTNGTYSLNNLKNNTYTQLTWIDDNKNSKWDKGKEKAAFIYPITTDTSQKIDLVVYKYDDKAPKYSYNQKFDKLISLNFDEPIYQFTSTPYIPYRINKEVVELYGSENLKSKITYTAKDSSLNECTDTLTIEFKESKIKNNFTATIHPQDFRYFENDTVYIQVNKPIKKFTPDSLKLNVYYNWILDTLQHRLLLIPQQYKDTIKIDAKTGYLTSVHGDSLEKVRFTLLKANPEEYGIIEYQIVTSDSTFIAHLINKKGKVVHTLINQKHGRAINLAPDSYSIIYIQDSNGNGKWDGGDIFNNIAPEKIIYTNKSIVLKANWEIKEQKIEISEQ